MLARAADPPLGADVPIVMAAVGVAAAVAVAAAVPVVIAVRRRHGRRESIAAVVVLWGLVAASAAIWAVNRSWSSAEEQRRQLLSGDADPADPVPQATTPWALWGGLAAANVGLIGWAAAGRTGGPGAGGHPG